ncbi:MAG: PD40 domain-containing protein [Candidatus Aminicenantes bacterium]|nr:PD40 domain-containing protein [Candidatus Aminicenantes bacterium]
MNKSSYLFLAVILSLGSMILAQERPFPVFKGPYLGQTPPGSIPEKFAPGFISIFGYDFVPTFSPALDEVFWGHRPTEEGSDNKLYYSRMVNGRWEKPVLAPFSSGAMEYEAQLAVDGKTLYFTRDGDLYLSRKTETGWSEARVLDPPVTKGMCPAVAANGNLYFTAARNKVYGIFCSRFADGSYQEPEIAIRMAAHSWIAPDESFMVFDKYIFNNGVQTSKLYVSFRRSDETWGDPIDLGRDVNVNGTELIAKISPDGKYLFFQRKVDGDTDIYWVDAKIVHDLK